MAAMTRVPAIIDVSAEADNADARIKFLVVMASSGCELFAAVSRRSLSQDAGNCTELSVRDPPERPSALVEGLAMMGGYGRGKPLAMRILPKDYADAAKMRSPSRGSVRVMARTLLLPRQRLRRQLSK